MKGEKNVEISVLKTKELVKPRVPYSHFVFNLGRRVVQNRKVADGRTRGRRTRAAGLTKARGSAD